MTRDTDSGAELEQTRVDLGDDLIEKTAVLSHTVPIASPDTTQPITSDNVEDQLESARILLGEDLAEDAKKLLHRILIFDPHHFAAHELLKEIHEEELKQIFGESGRRGIRKPGTGPEAAAIDSDAVMRKLDEDLGLGVLSLNQMSIFGDRKSVDKFCQKLERDLASHSPRDRMDVGVAFLEMDLFDVAERQFAAVIRELSLDPSPEAQRLLVSATALSGLALILGGRPFEAASLLDSVLRNSEIRAEEKTELLYLMGRAHEGMGKPRLASGFYRQVQEIDPGYRDVSERARA